MQITAITNVRVTGEIKMTNNLAVFPIAEEIFDGASKKVVEQAYRCVAYDSMADKVRAMKLRAGSRINIFGNVRHKKVERNGHTYQFSEFNLKGLEFTYQSNKDKVYKENTGK